MKKLAWVVALALAALVGPIEARAQPAPPSGSFSLSAVGQHSPWLVLQDQSTCVVTVYNVGVGTSLAVEGTNDGATVVSLTGIGTSGFITTYGTFGGSIATAGSALALHGFRVTLAALTSGGPVTGYLNCSNAVGVSASGGGSSNVAITSPLGGHGGVQIEGVSGGTPVQVTSSPTNPIASSIYYGTYTRLTSSSATACTALETSTTGSLLSIQNNGPTLTVFPTFYDEGASPSCATADLIWGDGTTQQIGNGQVITLNIPIFAGIAVKLSGAIPSGNYLIVTRI